MSVSVVAGDESFWCGVVMDDKRQIQQVLFFSVQRAHIHYHSMMMKKTEKQWPNI